MFERSKGSESVLSEHLLSSWERPTHRNLTFPFLLQSTKYRHVTNLKHESTLKFIAKAHYEFRRQEGSPSRFVLHIQSLKIHLHTYTHTNTHAPVPHTWLLWWHKTTLTNRKKTDTSFLYLCLSCIWDNISFHLYRLFSVHHPGMMLPGFALSIAIGTPPAASKLESWGDRLHLSV